MDPWNNASPRRDEWTSHTSFQGSFKMEPAASDANDTAETEVADDKNFKERVQEFGESVTLHGARYVTNPKYHGIRRLVWVAFIIALNINLWFSVVGSIYKYFQYPVESFVRMSYASNLTFPAVTLCNYNQFRRSAVAEDLIYLLYRFYNPVTGQNDLNWTQADEFWQSSGYTLESTVLDGGHQISDMLVNCSWRTSRRCSVDDFKQVITDWGLCYTFNDPENMTDARIVNQPGNTNGLSLRLNVEQNEYVYGEDSAAGIKILLHPQGVRPLVREFGLSVSPGFETSVSVRLTKHTNMKYPHPSKCKSTEDGSEYSRIYTVYNCQYECRIRYATNKCECPDYRYPGDQIPYCSPGRLQECLYPAEEEFYEKALGKDCKCPVTCDSSDYDAKISMSFFPARYIVEDLVRILNSSKDHLRENYLDLNIFFESMSYESVTEVEAYGADTLQSDIGGSMGLLAGMSLVTLAEFVDFIIATCYRKFVVKDARHET